MALVKNIDVSNKDTVLRIGDVSIKFLRVGERRVRVSVDAPPTTAIRLDGGEESSPVDPSPPNVVEGG